MSIYDGRMRVRAAFKVFYGAVEQNAIAAAQGAKADKETEPGKGNIANRERHLRHLQEVLEREGVIHIGQMTDTQVLTAYNECANSMIPRFEDDILPGTLRNLAASFKAFINYHVDRGAIPPTQRGILIDIIPKKRRYDRPMLIIPGEKWPEIFKYAGERHIMDRVICELCFWLGMRSSEARGVKWKDFEVDFTDVRFFRKKRNSKLKLPPPIEMQNTLQELRLWLIDMGIPPEPHWPVALARIRKPGRGMHVKPDWTCKPGQPVDATVAIQGLKAALRDSGLKPEEMKCQGLHIARRSRACQLLRQGVDVHVISKLLGHDDYHSTLTYIRDAMGDEDLREALNRPLIPTQEMEFYNRPAFGAATGLSANMPSNLPAVPQDKEALAKAALDMYTGGILNKDEFQAMLMRLMN